MMNATSWTVLVSGDGGASWELTTDEHGCGIEAVSHTRALEIVAALERCDFRGNHYVAAPVATCARRGA